MGEDAAEAVSKGLDDVRDRFKKKRDKVCDDAEKARRVDKEGQQAVDDALVALSRAAETDANLMLPLIDTVRTRATVGEIMNTLADVFGRYQEKPFI